jgi:DNA-binding NarL/FixJ family response regulator
VHGAHLLDHLGAALDAPVGVLLVGCLQVGGRPVAEVLSDAAGIELIGLARPGWEAVDLAQRAEPDLVLCDLAPPDGATMMRAILGRTERTRVLVVSTDGDRERILDAIDAGAIGYLLTEDGEDALLDGIRAAARGESPLAPRAARALIAGHRPVVRDDGLNHVQRRVLVLLGQGSTDAEIAADLQLDDDTLELHLAVIQASLGVTGRTQAALWAQRNAFDGRGGDPGLRRGHWSAVTA